MLRTVNAGQSLQAAVDAAQPGDVISVEAGASFRGPIEPPVKSGEAEIVIQSSRSGDLPQGRINPVHSGLMPKIICPNADQAIRTKPGAHHYKFDGIEVVPDAAATTLFDLIRFGGSRHEQQTLASVPHHLKLDRCLVRGLPSGSVQRGLSLNSSDSEVTRCYFAEIYGVGVESQAVASWNTPGRNKIIDNYLEAASENIMIGGADSFSPEFIPSDYQILRNYCFTPLTWQGKGYAKKNILELKSARRVLIDGNVFENCWTDGQDGKAILFTVRNQECSAPWSTVEDVIFTNNIIKNAEGGLNFLGSDNEVTVAFGKCNPPSTSGRGQRVLVKNNLFYDIRGSFLQLNGFYEVTLDRNTSVQRGNLMTLYGEQSQGFKFLNHLTVDHEFGIFGDGGLIGTAALNKFTPGWAMTGNVIAGPYGTYPPGNQYPASLTLPADFRSPFAGVGCDIDALMAAQGGSTTTPPPVPPPLPTQPAPSPDGTKGNTIIDSLGQVWTLGKKGETLRDGVHMADGFGKEYKFTGGVVYVRWDSTWYKWDGVRWVVQGQQEPGGVSPNPVPVTPTPPATGTRYEHDTSPADVTSMNAKGAQGWELVTVVSGLAWFRRVKL